MPTGIQHENEETQSGISSAQDGIADGTETAGGNIDPSVSGALEEGNAETDGDLDGARDGTDRLKDASDALDDNEGRNASNAGGIDTELSSDGGSGRGSPMLGSGSGMPQQQPQMFAPQASPQPQMPPMQMPQTPQMNPANFKMPQESLNKLLSGYNPKEASTAGGSNDLGRAAPKGGISNADKIDVSQVRYDKTGLGPLTNSELRAVIDEALDKNGISKDPSVRAQWHEVLTFMAEKESSRNPDAVNLTDSNAIGAPAADGHPGQSSRGIWQTIPTTFAAYHVAGTSTNIYDPVACGAAAVNYIMDRYNVDPSGGSSLQAFYSRRMGGGYTGY